MATDRQPEPMRVLLLEDVPTDAEITLRELRKVGVPFQSRRVETRENFVQALRDFQPDVILSDFSLPTSFDGLAALDIARELLPDIPYVFVSGTIGEDRAVEAMKRGATDYVLKERLNRLVPVIRRALHEKEEREARRRAEEELEETRNRLNSIVSALPDVIWSVSPEPYRLLYVSPSFKSLWGSLLQDIERDVDAWFRMVHPAARARVEGEWRNAMRGEPLDATYRVVREDGTVRWINNRAQARRDETGRIVRLDGIARDVTRGKIQEQRITRLNRMLSVLSGINTIIVRATDRNQLFKDACRIIVENGGFDAAWIGLLDRDGERLLPTVWAGRDTDFLATAQFAVREGAPGAHGIVAVTLRTGRAVIVNDIRHDSRVTLARELLPRGFMAAATLPLTAGDAVVGVLAFYGGETGCFDDEQARLLDELAGDISFALDHLAKAERLDYLAYYDTLTGLPNRSLFQQQVAQIIHSRAPNGQGLALVMLDPERFRHINETLGIAAGDALLKQFAERLSATVGEPGAVCRISADRFALALVPVVNAAEIAHAIEQRVFSALNEPFSINGQELHIAAKAGVAVYPSDGKDPGTLLLNAEAAVTRAKQSGERYLFYAPEMNARVAEQLRIENELRKALQEEQFVLFYQPKMDLQSGQLCGMEALIRWQHPQRGLIPPGEFVPVLEHTGMILAVGRWAIKRAALDHAAWSATNLKPPRIAVNVSQVQLRREEFVEDVTAAIAGTGCDCIDIEITESMLMDDISRNIEKLAALRAAGIGIALDD
ncbi:MAG: EAL domain-containing protein, partial [Betaproteobacteria bacterium]